MQYKMMTAKEAVNELFTRKDRKIDFTFDQDTVNPSEWYCIKLTQIFDEDDYVLAIGYYGGGCTEAYDIYGLVDNSDNEECVKEFCEQKLQNFMNTWYDSIYYCEKICVELEENDTIQND